MYMCIVCKKTIYDPNEDDLCYACVCKAKREYIKKYAKEIK